MASRSWRIACRAGEVNHSFKVIGIVIPPRTHARQGHPILRPHACLELAHARKWTRPDRPFPLCRGRPHRHEMHRAGPSNLHLPFPFFCEVPISTTKDHAADYRIERMVEKSFAWRVSRQMRSEER